MVTGPVDVEGAMPGDVLLVDILELETAQNWGFHAILPLLRPETTELSKALP